MAEEQHKSYLRVNQSWLAANEREILIYLAKSMPWRVKPDHLTLLGLIGSLLCFIGFVTTIESPRFLWLVVVGLVINWGGDSLDGNLARVRRIERPKYGFFVDHASDIISQVFIFMGLAISPYVRFDSGCLLLMSYWLASMFTFVRTISSQVFQISYFGIGPTEIRIGLLIYVFSLMTVGPLPLVTPLGVLSLMDVLAMTIFAAVTVSFAVMTFLEARRLRVLDRSPTSPRPANGILPTRIGLEPLEDISR